MSESTVITEFGSSKIAIGLTGEGVPMKVFNSLDHGFLSRKNHINKNSSSSSFNLRHHQRKNQNNDDADEFLLLDIESCGLGCIGQQQEQEDRAGNNNDSSGQFVGNHQQFINSFASSPSDFKLLQNLFTSSSSADPRIAGQILRQMIVQQSHLECPDNLMFIPPNNSIFETDAGLTHWAEIIIEAAGIPNFFPLRSAVAATIESGRQNAAVLDCGHSSARINLVVDGIQRVGKPGAGSKFCETVVECGGAALSKRFEEELFNSYIGRNKQNSENQEDAAAVDAASIQQESDHDHVTSSTSTRKLSCSFFPWLLSSTSSEIESSPFGIYSRGRIVQEAKHSCGIIWNPSHNNNNNNNNSASSLSLQQQMDQQVKPAIYNSPLSGVQVPLTGSARSMPFERLFRNNNNNNNNNNNSNGGENRTLVDLIYDLYHDLPADYRQNTPLLVVGGTARTEGFAQRLAAELAIVDTAFQHMPPRYPQDPYSQWRGASFVCATPTFMNHDSTSTSSTDATSWITKAKIEEHGVGRIRMGLP